MARRSSERPTYGFTVAAAIDAVPAARRQVVSLTRDLGLPVSDQTLETVELLAGEVIANAVLYTEAPCAVSVTRADERLRVEVTDVDASLPCAVVAGPNDESGRGLLLVDALADTWGTRPDPPGKTTWFEIMLGPLTDGLSNNSMHAQPSPRTDETAARRTERQAHMESPANSRASFVLATTGERRQVA